MSTSLLYQAFGVKGYEYKATRYWYGQVVFEIVRPRDQLRCPVCGSDRVICHGGVPRLFRGVPIGKKSVWLSLEVPRVECFECDLVRQATLGFADPKVRHTRAFARYALGLSRHMTIQDVARHLGVSWGVIKEIQREYLQRRFKKLRLRGLKHLAIDEISIGHGHRYLTVVLDLVSGAVVFVGKGKGMEALDPFWRRLRASRAKIRAVAIDMGPAYIAAVQKHLPRATIVFDHFHVIKLFNEKLSDLRRSLYHEATVQQKKVLKGSRWLLLKNPENLDRRRNEKKRLQEALKLNEPLALAYYLKEDLRQLWNQPGKRKAGVFLTDWCRRAKASDVPILVKFARLLAAHRRGILAWYDFKISTGPLEGTNNKIKTMQRQAYGFRDMDFFKLKIYAIHEARYELVG
ncbi:MAG: ISL3 family transposase [bacterium]